MAVLGAFAVCPVPVFMLLGGPTDLDAAGAGGWTAVLGWIVGLAVVSAASFAVHELVHAVFFMLFAPTGARGDLWGKSRNLHDLRLCRGRCVFAPAVCGGLPSADGCLDGGVCPRVCVLGLSAAVLLGGWSALVGLWAIGITRGPFCATVALSPVRTHPLACAFSQRVF